MSFAACKIYESAIKKIVFFFHAQSQWCVSVEVEQVTGRVVIHIIEDVLTDIHRGRVVSQDSHKTDRDKTQTAHFSSTYCLTRMDLISKIRLV